MRVDAKTRQTIITWGEIRRDPLKAFPRYFQIRDKRAKRLPFQPNRSQRLIASLYQKQRQAKKPVRIIVLKPRQTGITTFCEGLVFSQTATARDVESLIIAHDLQSAQHILRISNLYYVEFPEELKPIRKSDNQRQLYFNIADNPKQWAKGGAPSETKSPPIGLNSRIRIETANNVEAGRAHTIQNLHCSEFARWPKAKDTMLSLMQAVPYEPDTMILIESTAKGVGNKFYEMYQRAKSGDSDFEAIFIPWWIHEEYMKLTEPGFKRTPAEQKLAERWGLDRKFGQKVADEKLNWRRWAIDELCDGDLDFFHQEYPANDMEAFISSGKEVFHFKNLTEHYRPIAEAVRRKHYEVRDEKKQVTHIITENRGQVFDEAGTAKFEYNPHGPLRVYRFPEEDKYYHVSGDPSEGKPGGDKTSMQVLDAETCGQCAVWEGRLDTDIVAEEMAMLGQWYNWAMLIPERNAMGVAVINRLLRLKYPNIYKQDKLTKEGQWVEEFGWRSTRGGKETLKAVAAPHIRKCDVEIFHWGTVEELLHFVRKGDGRLEGEGAEDDHAIAWQIAMWACERMPYIEEQDEEVRELTNLERFMAELKKEPEKADKMVLRTMGRRVS